MRITDTGQLTLDLWSYFYISHYPREAEKAVWRRIECATFRIRESEPYLGARFPAALRLRHAKRVRRATREIMRLSEQLESVLDPWVAAAVGTLEGWADTVIEATREPAMKSPLH